MDCAKFEAERVLEAYGELGDSPEFRAHLASCPDCVDDVEDIREISSDYRAASSEGMPASLRDRAPAAGIRRWRSLEIAVSSIAAAVMIAVLLVPLLHRREGGKASDPTSKVTAKTSDETRGMTVLTFDEKIDLDRQKTIEWDSSEARVDVELRSLKRDIEFLEATRDGM